MKEFECTISFNVPDSVTAKKVAFFLEEELTCCNFDGGPTAVERRLIQEALDDTDENGSFSIVSATVK